MIYTENTVRAMRLAYRAHHGQTDKSGAPYIHHPLHLAEQMTGESETIAALLHDAVEDGGTTFDELRSQGFPEDAVQAVDALTHRPGVPYADYIRMVAENPIARSVKLADLAHNMDLSRLGMTEETMTAAARARMEKYAAAVRTLKTAGMTLRRGTIDDLAAVTRVEAECFPAAEAATEQAFAARLRVYPDRFWLLFDGETLVSFVNGMTTDEPDLRDEMYEDASIHNPNGRWQMIFGVNTLPAYRRQGCAGRLLNCAIRESRREGRSGLVLTCKEHMLHYYARFGFRNEGVSASVHGNVQWYQMRLVF